MALYEVTLRQRYFDQLCINVFPYTGDEGLTFTPNALDLLTAMGFIPSGDPLAFPADSIAAQIQDLQNSSVEFLSVEARELYSVTDFYEAVYSPPLLGTDASGTPVSPVMAFGLFSNRVRTDIRRGFKRFVGLGEVSMTTGGVLDSGFVDTLAILGDTMGEVLVGADSNYRPCVISRKKEAIPDTDPVRYRYVLYPTPEEQDEHLAVGVTYAPYSTVRTQVSRQYGRGQ